jgi:hypothetical protein
MEVENKLRLEDYCNNIHKKGACAQKQAKNFRTGNSMISKAKCLGIQFERRLTLEAHIEAIKNKT